MINSLKGQCREIFDFWFFHESVSPSSITAVSNFFENSHTQLKVPVSFTPVANLPPMSLIPVSRTLAKLVAKFATGVIDTGCKFAAGLADNGGNFAAGVIDTGGKFVTGVVDTGGAP